MLLIVYVYCLLLQILFLVIRFLDSDLLNLLVNMDMIKTGGVLRMTSLIIKMIWVASLKFLLIKCKVSVPMD